MYDKNIQHYKEQTINTMTKGELLLLLYDELVKRLTQAELALGKEAYPMFEECVQRSINIIDYLDATLDRQYEISHSLTRLYEYFTYELGRVMIGRNAPLLVHVREQLNELRGAFRIANSEAGTPQEAARQAAAAAEAARAAAEAAAAPAPAAPAAPEEPQAGGAE